MTTDNRTNDLVAEVGKHVPYAKIMDDAKWCIHCADEWPCVTRRLADALEASEARVKELEAQVKDFRCERVFRISEMQELVEAQQRISELEDMLAARQPSEDGKYILRLIETIKQTGGSVEVAGVKIMPCDEFGRTAAAPDAAIRELTEAIRLTVEYVGNDMLPAIEGWDWYDTLVKYAPEVAQAFVDKPIHFPKPTDAEAERGAALARIAELEGELEIAMRPHAEYELPSTGRRCKMTDTYCSKCDYDLHCCGGCGGSLQHGEYVCSDCKEATDD